jgi:hypothetical protein
MEEPELIDKYDGDKVFAAKFDDAHAVRLEKKPKLFKPSEVFGSNIVGFRIEQRFALLTTKEFQTYFKTAAEGVPGITMIPNLLSEEREVVPGIILPLHDAPERFQARQIVIYGDLQNVLTEYSLTEHGQILHEQAMDVFNVTNKAVIGARHPHISGSVKKVMDWQEMRVTTAKVEAERRRAEIEAERARNGEVGAPLVAAAQHRRGLAAPSSIFAAAPVAQPQRRACGAGNRQPSGSAAAGASCRAGIGGGVKRPSSRSTAGGARSSVASEGRGGPGSAKKQRGIVREAIDDEGDEEFQGAGGENPDDEVMTIFNVYPSIDMSGILNGGNFGHQLSGAPYVDWYRHIIPFVPISCSESFESRPEAGFHCLIVMTLRAGHRQ